MKNMTPIRYAILLFLAPWLFGMAFDAVVYLHVPNPLKWDQFARGVALITSMLLLVMVWPWTYALHQIWEDEA
jgi:hypothetical protein